jgi:YesN/AraC family two-component response regulator
MKVHIKYMISTGCKMLVRNVLKSMGLHFVILELGEVDIMENITTTQKERLQAELQDIGLELMEDKRTILLEKIKLTIIDLIHHNEEDKRINFSHYLSEKLMYDYTYMSNVFSEVMGISIEKYLIAQKIERIKELITYEELNINEIAWEMNYCNVAHLSNQFKKVTGLSPSQFKNLKNKKRIPVDRVLVV